MHLLLILIDVNIALLGFHDTRFDDDNLNWRIWGRHNSRHN